jgi:hypothetical protein
MGALFRVIWQIALLRQGPQVLPASSALLYLVLAVHWLVGVVLGLTAQEPDMALLSSLAGTLIMVALVHGLLLVHNLQSRVPQTLTALAASEILLALFTIPLMAWFDMGGSLRDIATVLSLLLFGWKIAITAHIFRHALDVTMGIGFLFAVGYIFVSLSLGSFLIPVEGS